MKQTQSYDSEPARFVDNDYDLQPLIDGIRRPERLAKWQAYARRTDNDELLAKLHEQAKQL